MPLVQTNENKMKIATTCPHGGSTEQYDYNSPNQQRSQTCKKCRKSYRLQVKNYQIVKVTKKVYHYKYEYVKL